MYYLSQNFNETCVSTSWIACATDKIMSRKFISSKSEALECALDDERHQIATLGRHEDIQY